VRLKKAVVIDPGGDVSKKFRRASDRPMSTVEKMLVDPWPYRFTSEARQKLRDALKVPIRRAPARRGQVPARQCGWRAGRGFGMTGPWREIFAGIALAGGRQFPFSVGEVTFAILHCPGQLARQASCIFSNGHAICPRWRRPVQRIGSGATDLPGVQSRDP
jgi:hypothetical protein